MTPEIKGLIRADLLPVLDLDPASAEPEQADGISLHLNENALGSPLKKWYNRYPDPHQIQLKQAVSKIKGVQAANIFLGSGTDECVDVLLKTFCEPEKDNILICNPGLERVQFVAALLKVEVRIAVLQDDFQPDLITLENLVDEHTKMIFLSSPNKISGVSIDKDALELILNNFHGLLVVDEAYVNFSKKPSLIKELPDYDRLVVLQTFSKAWGMAALRIAIAIGSPDVIACMKQIKGSFNISQCSADLFIEASSNIASVNTMIREIVLMRNALQDIFRQLPAEVKVYPSEANFILIRLNEARKLYEHLLNAGIRVFYAGDLPLCENGLRISVGNEFENTRLIDSIFDFFMQTTK